MPTCPALARSGAWLSLALAACTPNEPHDVFANIEPLEVTIPLARPGVPPQFVQFRIRNTGADTIYISAASDLAKGEMADVVQVNLTSFTQVPPEVTFPLEVTLDPRTWRWRTGEYSIEFPFEVRYFFSGQAEDEPESPSFTEAPESIVAIKKLKVNFSIDCDQDDDGFDAVACGGVDCRDDLPEVNPDAEEICDDLDNDCTGAIDDWATDRDIYYLDADQDGYGDIDTEVLSCGPPTSSHRSVAGDCNDNDDRVSPRENEACFDDIDNDCNDLIDEEDPFCFF